MNYSFLKKQIKKLTDSKIKVLTNNKTSIIMNGELNEYSTI
jgi:hypothetical protein